MQKRFWNCVRCLTKKRDYISWLNIVNMPIMDKIGPKANAQTFGRGVYRLLNNCI